MDEAIAQRALDRIGQLHRSEAYETAQGVTVAVCVHCRRDDGGRVVQPCPTMLLVKSAWRNL